MTPTPPSPSSAAERTKPRRDRYAGKFKDLYFTTVLPGESVTEALIRHHFQRAGYKVWRFEFAPTHPVIILKIIRTSAPPIEDDRQFFRHIREILKQAGYFLKKDELTVNRERKRVLVAFISGQPTDPMEILRAQNGFEDLPM